MRHVGSNPSRFLDPIWRQIKELWAAVQYASAASGSNSTNVSVDTAGGAGFVVGTAAAPYVIKSTDRYINMNADSGATQVGVQLSAGKTIGERHTFWYFWWNNAGNPQPLITCDHCVMTVFAPQAPGTGQTTNAQTIGTPYSFATVEWDGTMWRQVG